MKSILKVAVLISCLTSVHSHIYSQENTSASSNDLNVRYPRPLISKIEVLTGGSFIYGVWKDSQSSHAVKIGYSANIGFVHEFNSRVGINVKLLYEDKGIKDILYSPYDPPSVSKSITDITLNYLTVSVLPRYSLDQKNQFYLSIGPYFSYLLSNKYSAELYVDGELFQKSSYRSTKSSTFKEYDFGATALIGYDIHFNQRIGGTIQVLYNAGLINASKPEITPFRNNTISLLLGITIPKKKLE